MNRCECCGATEGVGNLARLCPPCFQSLSLYRIVGQDLCNCTLHNKVLTLSHDR